MRDTVPRRVTESEIFAWPWATPHGLAIVVGADGGGGEACGGGLGDGKPVKRNSEGCHYGTGGEGGCGAIARLKKDR